MKILHCCISNFYIDKYNYQENILSKTNKLDGHQVYIIASNYTFLDNDNTKYVQTTPRRYVNEFDIPVERIPYKRIGTTFITEKLKKVDGLYERIEEINPDIILFHGTSSLEILTLIKYKKKHDNVKIYIDSHADYYTTGTNWFSKKILHGVLFSYCLKRALPYIEKIFYISIGCGDFLREVYRIPEKKLEFFSLGGLIPNNNQILESRETVNNELKIDNSYYIILQAGKFDSKKKLIEALEQFKLNNSEKFIYLIAGSLSDDIRDRAIELISQDNRVRFLGWKNGEELQVYLNACDIYIQPGKVSAIAQDAICRQCMVILNNLKEYRRFVNGNGFLINTLDDIHEILNEITEQSYSVEDAKMKSKEIASEYFDYKKLAARLYK